jgi:hypothetical protein
MRDHRELSDRRPEDIHPASDVAEEIARSFHSTYEHLAPDYGYRTREESAKPWHEVPAKNRALMEATVQHLIDIHVIKPGDAQEMAEDLMIGSLRLPDQTLHVDLEDLEG